MQTASAEGSIEARPDPAARSVDATGLSPDDPIFAQARREIDRVFPAHSIKRVLLVLPPDGSSKLFRYSGAKNRHYHNHPPYGCGVLAAQLRKDGLQVSILNLNNVILRECQATADESQFDYDAVIARQVKAALDDFSPDFVGVSTMFSMAHDSALDVCRRIKETRPDVPIALGGVHFTNSFKSSFTREALLRDVGMADFIFLFEAELAFRNFVRIVNGEAELTQLSQVAFIRCDPVIHFNNRTVPDGSDIDIMPAFDLMSLCELSDNGVMGQLHFLKPPGTRMATAISNRGCRAQCRFCSVRQINGIGVRGRAVQSVIDELLVLKSYGIEHVIWLDDDLLYDGARALRLFNEIVRQDVGLTWDCSNGVIAAACTDELMAGAEAAGCTGLFIGMESGNPKILKQIKKPGTVKNFIRAATILRRYEKINARVFLMFGFPGETFRMIRDTIEVARAMNLDWNTINALQPLPATPIYETVAEYRDFSKLAYNIGSYGTNRKQAEQIGDVLCIEFEDAFTNVDLDAIPGKDQYDRIWAYMFFHLNYERLLREDRPVKLRQAYAYIERIARLIIPRSGFAWYFLNYLRKRIDGAPDVADLAKLHAIIDQHPFYRERFRELGLDLDWVVPSAGPLAPSVPLYAAE